MIVVRVFITKYVLETYSGYKNGEIACISPLPGLADGLVVPIQYIDNTLV